MAQYSDDALVGVTVLTPSQFNLSGTKGDIIERTLLIRSQNVTEDLDIIPLDLVRTDDLAIFPASKIQAIANVEEGEENRVTIPIRFDLRGVENGKFIGEILIHYAGSEQFLPITVTVKEPWPLPLILLLLGVALGMGISGYRVRGRQRDEILVRIGQLTTRVDADNALASDGLGGPFRQRLDSSIIDVQTSFRSEDWEIAKSSLVKAEGIFDKWRKERDNWLLQLEYQIKTLERVNDDNNLNQDVKYVRELKNSLSDMAQRAPEYVNAAALRDSLDMVANRVNQYYEISDDWEDLNVHIKGLSFQNSRDWQFKSNQWADEIDNLSPTKDSEFETKFTALQSDIKGAIAQIETLNLEQGTPEIHTGPGPGPSAIPQGGTRGLVSSIREFFDAPPNIQSFEEGVSSNMAQWRLRIFTGASYVVSILLLAGAGFNELYVDNAIFGQNIWGDYFGLIGWGFGSEATRVAVTDMIQNWSVSGAANVGAAPEQAQG
ncbi:MAG: hypothetical protein AAF639_12475 [Chloroflexota bacterium]